MLSLTLVVLALSHNQNGNTDCSRVIRVHDESTSQSFWLENSTCTFSFSVPVIRKLSVTRVSTPLLPGDVTINGKKTVLLQNVSGSVEPFALIPMWQVFDLDEANIGTSTIKVRVEGKAMFSFGKAEDMGLTLGMVVPHSYKAREWVYHMPAAFMWATHAFFLLTVAGLWTLRHQLTLPLLTAWVFVSATVDMSVWSALSANVADGHGTAFWVVTAMRTLVYCFLLYTLLETPVKPPGQWGGFPVWAVAVPMNLCGYVVLLAIMADKTITFILIMSVGLIVLAKLVYEVLPYLNFAIFLSLIAITLNIGAFVLVPACLLHAYRRKTAVYSPPEDAKQVRTTNLLFV